MIKETFDRYFLVLLLSIWLFGFLISISTSNDLLFNYLRMDTKETQSFLIEDNTRNIDFSMFSEINSNYYKGLKSIEFHKEISYEGFLTLFSGVEGTYRFYHIDIFDTEAHTPIKIKWNFYHELGHHIYWYHLKDKERKEWQKLFRNTRKEDFISEYASKNANEDFAENFMSYLSNQDKAIICYISGFKDCTGIYIEKKELKFIIENIVLKLDNERISKWS